MTDSAIYSTDKNIKYYYICPKFWDINKNISLTKKQVDSGDYGTIYSTTNLKGNILSREKSIYTLPRFLNNKLSGDDFEAKIMSEMKSGRDSNFKNVLSW